MDGGQVIDLGRQALYVFLSVAGPILGIGMVVGVVIAFFQSITQVQEMTLTFVPKILAVFVGLQFLFPFMGARLTALFEEVMTRIIASGATP